MYFTDRDNLIFLCRMGLKQNLIFKGRKVTTMKLYNNILYGLKTYVLEKKNVICQYYEFIDTAMLRLLPEFRMISWYPSFRSLIRIPVPANLIQRICIAARWLKYGVKDVYKTYNYKNIVSTLVDMFNSKKVNAAITYKIAMYVEGLENLSNIRFLKSKKFFSLY